jgi:light-harvesting complex I chlorophyll a/b binding protein 1
MFSNLSRPILVQFTFPRHFQGFISTKLYGDARSPDGLGVDPGPLDLFDPMGYISDREKFPRRRAIEIKHGRIAMVAFVGMLMQELDIHMPGNLDIAGNYPFGDVLEDGMGFPALLHIPPLGIVQILMFAAIAELKAVPGNQYTGGPQNLPGGYDGFPGLIPGGYPFVHQIANVEERDRALNVEIQNGRAAMMGVTGAMIHSMLDSCDHHFFYPITHN